jgi:hypothetical protein
MRQVALRDIRIVSLDAYRRAEARYSALVSAAMPGAGGDAAGAGTGGRETNQSLVMFCERYDEGWTLAQASQHFPTALDENAFVVPSNDIAPLAAEYRPRGRRHAAFILGSIVLLAGVVLLARRLFRTPPPAAEAGAA